MENLKLSQSDWTEYFPQRCCEAYSRYIDVDPTAKAGPVLVFYSEKSARWIQNSEPSRYGLPLCVLTRFRAFHGRSLWAFLGPANVVCYAHWRMTLVYLGAETVKRRIKKSTMRQVGLRLPLNGAPFSRRLLSLTDAKVLIMRILCIARGFPSDDIPRAFLMSSREIFTIAINNCGSRTNVNSNSLLELFAVCECIFISPIWDPRYTGVHLPARLPVKHDGTAGPAEAKEWKGLRRRRTIKEDCN